MNGAKSRLRNLSLLRAWQRKLHEGRWAAVSWPKEYGGRSATLMQQALFGKRWRAWTHRPWPTQLVGPDGPTIVACGTEAQKKRYIPKILSAEEIWCQGFSEPNAGSDLARFANGSTGWTAITTS